MRASLLRACSLGSFGVIAAVAAAAIGCGASPAPPEDLVVVAIAESAPPPLSGGTLIVSADERRAIAADSDRDVVWVADLLTEQYERSIVLEKNDEPGRLVEDSAGMVHVALRRAGAVLTFDPNNGDILRRTKVCIGPRGLAFDGVQNVVHVACADGKLVTLDAKSGKEVRRLSLQSDLRDIVMQGDKLMVTRFRSAEVLLVDASGKVTGTGLPEVVTAFSNFDGSELTFTPDVAWRAVARPNGGMLMVHQQAQLDTIEIEEPSGYDEAGTSIVRSALTEFDAPNGWEAPSALGLTSLEQAVLPVDVAISKDGGQIAVAAAGSKHLLIMSAYNPTPFPEQAWLVGMPVAVAYAGTNVVAQVREPASIEIPSTGVHIVLPGKSVRDTGYDMFHMAPGSFRGMNGFEGSGHHFDDENGESQEFRDEGFGGGTSLSCASCHPEGGDDSHTWSFSGVGARRTQTMRGGVLETLPLHWDGDMDEVSSIMNEVFSHRMGGPRPGPGPAGAIEHWIGQIPAPPALRSANDDAAQRGKAIFEDQAVGCASCHSGTHFTNNLNTAIGKGKSLQVPSLVGVAWRAPYMHDGCAATLADRFNPQCGGMAHGDISNLTSDDLADLVAYLESL